MPDFIVMHARPGAHRSRWVSDNPEAGAARHLSAAGHLAPRAHERNTWSLREVHLFVTPGLVFMTPGSVSVTLSELFMSDSLFFATKTSVNAKNGECRTAKSFVMATKSDVFVVDGLL